MSAAIAIPSIISAVGSVGSALIGSSASKTAAKTQTDASDKALALQKEMYNTTRSDLSPWTNAGGQAVTALSSLMGLPSGSVGGGSSGNIQTVLGQPLSGQASSRTNPGPNADYTGQKAVSRYDLAPGTVESGGTMPLASVAGSRSNPQTIAQAQTASGYVTMRAPNGETQAVPSSTVNLWKSRGAVVVQ
jgi:hypothetical protein